MKPIKTVMEEIKYLPKCPRSGEINLYYLLLKLKEKRHEK